jgi:hypothetical protein
MATLSERKLLNLNSRRVLATECRCVAASAAFNQG